MAEVVNKLGGVRMMLRAICTHRVSVEIVDGTGTGHYNSHTSNRVDDSLVLCYPR